MRFLSAIIMLLTLPLYSVEAGKPAVEYPYLPPSWADRVVFYHSFEKGLNAPEINLVSATIKGEAAKTSAGLAGLAYQSAPQKKTALELSCAALSPHKPFTLMFWFRLDEAMKDETTFQLLKLDSKRGYTVCMLHGKGDWCALKQPTGVTQLQGFANFPKLNNLWDGKAWFEPGVWHHMALTVSDRTTLKYYWDGVLKDEIVIKGGQFQENDFSHAVLDVPWASHPLSFDDLIVCDRALSAEELVAYGVSVRQLAGVKFPVVVPSSK